MVVKMQPGGYAIEGGKRDFHGMQPNWNSSLSESKLCYSKLDMYLM